MDVLNICSPKGAVIHRRLYSKVDTQIRTLITYRPNFEKGLVNRRIFLLSPRRHVLSFSIRNDSDLRLSFEGLAHKD